MSDIYTQLVKVMASVGAIKKGQENKFDRYKFRGIDDVYNELHPALVEHGVVVVPNVLDCTMDTFETTKGAIMQRAVIRVRHDFYASDGSCIEVTTMGEGADRGDKAINKAHSSAYKTAVFQALCIPTQEKSDSEHESPDGQAPRKKAAAKKAKPAPAPEKREPTDPVSEADLQSIKEAAFERHQYMGDRSPGQAGMITEVFHAIGACKYKEVGLAQMPKHLTVGDVPAMLSGILNWEPQAGAEDFAA